MSGFIDWIGAQADDFDPAQDTLDMPQNLTPQTHEQPSTPPSPQIDLLQSLPAHNFPPTPPKADEAQQHDTALDRNPDLWLYRDRTVALLRRYVRLALETGRLPSLIGRELFRARVTSYTATSFEDRVIFVHDVEACLARLDPFDQGIIARMILQEHGLISAARLLHCTRQTIARRLPEVLDELTEQFLKLKLLTELP